MIRLAITKDTCNSFTLEATGATFTDILYIDQYVDGSLVNIIAEAMEGHGDQLVLTFTPTEDGVYVVHFNNSVEEVYINILADCAITTCVKNYLDILLSTSKTNCDCTDTIDTDLYNFNALMILYNTYLSMFNREGYFTENAYIGTALTTMLADMYSVDTILKRALDYCDTCDKPCVNC